LSRILWHSQPSRLKWIALFDIVALNNKNPTWYAEDLKALMGYLAEGKIAPVIARRMPLVEARQAQELILGAKVKGKIVLICDGPIEIAESASPSS
jgi:NADPH:quinone reductase-like Zn-dependent oxidoreductase